MKKKMKKLFSFMHYKKEYLQEIRSYLLLLLFPLFLCVALYFSVQRITIAQIENQADNTAHQFYLYSSTMLSEVDIISNSILSDVASKNNESTNEDLYAHPENFTNLINIRKGNSAYIDHIYFISKEHNIIISDNGHYTYESLPSILEEIGASEEDLANQTETTWHMTTSKHLSNPYCVVPYHDENGITIAYIVLTLNLDTFINTVFDPETEFSCIFNHNSFIASKVLYYDSSTVDWSDPKVVEQLLGNKVKCIYIEMDDFTYMVAISSKIYYQPFSIISGCFVLYVITVFVVGLFYLYNVSKKRYLQLSSLIEALPQNTTISYQNLIPMVQKSLLEFRDEKATHQIEVSEQVLHNILYGFYGTEITSDLLLNAGILTPDSSFYIASFYINSHNNIALEHSHTEDTKNMTRIIFQSTLSQFAGEDVKFTSCMDLNGIVAIFYDPSISRFGSGVQAICESVDYFITKSYGIQVQTMVSEMVSSPGELPKAFHQTQSLRRFANSIDSTAHVLSQEMLQNNGSVLINGDFIRQQQTLINTLLVGKYDMIPSMVDAILQQHVSTLGKDYSLAFDRLNSISNILSEAIIYTNLPDIDKQSAADELRQSDSICKLNDAVSKIFSEMQQNMLSNKTHHKEVDKACAYIQENLENQNLNVSAICDAAGIIVQRLAPMFRDQFDMGIAEYVNFYRIEQAKQLLSNKKLTIKQIAAKVGYSNTDTLTRNFRKLESLTPTEYRNLKL